MHAKWFNLRALQKIVEFAKRYQERAIMSRNSTLSGSPRRENGTPSRWDQYRELLVAKRIPQKAQRWYVTHVEQFLGAVHPNSLKGLATDDITGYLRQTSSQGKWQDWQFRQMVDALQLLLVELADVKSAQVVDWDYWRKAGAVLPADHPTIAREQAPEARLKAPKFASSAEVFPILASPVRRSAPNSIRFAPSKPMSTGLVAFYVTVRGKPVETLGPAEVDAFLTHLAVERSVAPSTQSVALNALVFFFNEVLEKPLDGLKFSRARRRDRVPVVLTREEVERLLGCMEGTYGLIAGLLYGTGMRLLEGLRLRVADVDFGHESIVCNSPAGSRLRYPHRAGAFGSRGRADDHDLYPCAEPSGDGSSEESGGFLSPRMSRWLDGDRRDEH